MADRHLQALERSDFAAKLVDVVRLYLDPPERAVVLCVDEQTQVQALDRIQSSLPMTKGRAQTMTHDYQRHGTTDLFAALNVESGDVTTALRERHTGRDVLAVFQQIDKTVPVERRWLADLGCVDTRRPSPTGIGS